MIINRIVELKHIALPVRVSHGNLSSEERIDEQDNRIDILDIDVYINYQSKGKLKNKSLDGVWNYGKIYNALCLSELKTITGPLESILDEALKIIENSALEQNIHLNEIIVKANRLGLSVGYPQLVVKKSYQKNILQHESISRSAGICNYPLIVLVNHDWCVDDERIEHIDLRQESVKLSFNAETKSQTLSDNLSGLYNYAGLIHQVQKLHGHTINGPVEQLCDDIANLLEKDAKNLKLDLIKTSITIERTGYARCTPLLSLVKYYF